MNRASITVIARIALTNCIDKLMRDAADAIERLAAQVAELEQDKEFLQFLAKLYHDELDEETKKNIDGHLHYDCRKGEKSDGKNP